MHKKKPEKEALLRAMKIAAISLGTCVCTYAVVSCIRKHRYIKLLSLLSQP